MGDRTHVSIQIRKIDYEWLLRAEFNDDPEQMRETLYYEYLEFQDDIVVSKQMKSITANGMNWGPLVRTLHRIRQDLGSRR